MTREEFISAATKLYGDRYDYSSITEQRVIREANIPIRCCKHGTFYTTPYQLLHGLIGGCFECYKERWWEDKEKGL